MAEESSSTDEEVRAGAVRELTLVLKAPGFKV